MSAAVIASLITPPPRRSSLYPVQRTPSLTNSESTTPDSSEEIVAFPPVPNALPSTSLPSISEKGKEPVYSIPSIPVTPPLSPRRPRQRRRRDSIYGVFTDARILSILLPYLTWEDVRALCYASHHFWLVMSKPRPKDVLLAHFVPGYRVALRSRDRRHYEDVIRMDLQDFELLSVSISSFPIIAMFFSCFRFFLPLVVNCAHSRSVVIGNSTPPLPHARSLRSLQ